MNLINGELDDELVREFLGEMNDAYCSVEQIVIALEQKPGEMDLLNELFRTLHSLKSNLRMMQMGSYSDLVHGVENVLDLIRRGKISYSTMLGDLFLLATYEAKVLCSNTISNGEINTRRCKELDAALRELSFAAPAKLDHAVRGVIDLLDPGFLENEAKSAGSDDVQLFREFAQQQEARSGYWQGRAERIVDIAQLMVRNGSVAIDEQQMQAAVYIHDMAMAFLPLELLHKADALDGNDRERLHKHPYIAGQLLRQLGGWDEAALFAEQHHEWHDGGGYPCGLKGDEICHGARILAIADTFESMTQNRADREHRRTVLRAVAEINNMKGTQFDPEWVEVFNDVVRQRYSSR